MHYITLDYQTKMGMAYNTFAPSSGDLLLFLGVANPT